MDNINKAKKDRAKRQDATEMSEPKPHKETNKISEIIRTVKKNSSLRLKGSRNSKVMFKKKMCDNKSEVTSRPTNMTDSEAVGDSDTVCADTADSRGNKSVSDTSSATTEKTPGIEDSNPTLPNGKCDSNDNMKEDKRYTMRPIDAAEVITGLSSNVHKSDDRLMHLPGIAPTDKERNRKLSLDHTILLRGESFSQSEADLNSVGTLPLKRKSSFFRKRMESFLKNTSEVFRRQSVKRKGSMSLQSLPEHCGPLRAGTSISQDVHRGSVTSLSSYAAVAGSEWSLNSKTQDGDQASLAEDQASLVGSQSSLAAGQPLLETSDSTLSLNEAYHLEAYLNSRAQSVSSGLDTATQGTRRRKATNRANRVTWLASEGLTNYLRRIIKDEEGRKSPVTNQEGSSCQEFRNKMDSKGRRLSYQRAVSGEDPVRYLDSLRRPLIPEQPEQTSDLATDLIEFSRNGVPTLKGFCLTVINSEAFKLLHSISNNATIDESFNCPGLSHQEESRHAAIKEFIVTEVDYITHLKVIVEVFIATAHALQDSGHLLAVDTARLFSNIPDILNANLQFWDLALYPMLQVYQSSENNQPFDTDLMIPGFKRFNELFYPYDKYLGNHSKSLEYLKSLSNDSDFQLYLSWCHSHRACKRLNLTDLMIMPMQRIARYHLILERIHNYTNSEPQRSSLFVMEMTASNFVLDINRSIRRREEVEKLDELADALDFFEVDFKDDDMDSLFRTYTNPNLKAPMRNCLSSQYRCVLLQSDLKYRDSQRETRIDVRGILLTDMLLICKKLSSKASPLLYKMIRPKFMLYNMKHITQYAKNPKEVASIILLARDDLGSSYECIQLSEPSRNSNPQLMKTWDMKFREAKKTYELSVWAAKNPSRDVTEYVDPMSSYSARLGLKLNSEEINIDREARERVAAMLYETKAASTDCDNSQASLFTDSMDGSGGRSGRYSLSRHPMHRTSTGGSSRNSRLSSLHHSMSGTSRDEPIGGQDNIYQPGTSAEHSIPPTHPVEASTSITVYIQSESELETVEPLDTTLPSIAAAVAKIATSSSMPPTLKSLQKCTYKTPRSFSKPASKSTSSSKHNSLKVQPQQGVMALVHSLPDLSLDPSPRPCTCSSLQSASDKLYQSHQELLQLKRLAAGSGRFLSPDHRGTSYPPPSPRALLKRGFAFSYSIKNPPLSKMGHVNSQSNLQFDAAPSVPIPSGVTLVLQFRWLVQDGRMTTKAVAQCFARRLAPTLWIYLAERLTTGDTFIGKFTPGASIRF